MTLIDHLIQVSERYRHVRGISASRLSSIIFGDGKVLPELAVGKRDITTRRLEMALRWFSDHWPADTEWPATVKRPEKLPAEETT